MRTKVKVGDLEIGGGSEPVIMAGPCSVAGETEMLEIAVAAKVAGANILRGGAYKPRTRPESFQGLGEDGLKCLADARQVTGLPIISEVTAEKYIDTMKEYVDILQIGSRNMQNYELLKSIGKYASNVPVMLKRGMTATKEELMGALDYLIHHGHNDQIMICERGVRTSVNQGYSRNVLDLNIVSDLKKSVSYPIIVDPSHAAGRADMITDLSRAAIAAGADGLIIEMHTKPAKALSDAAQHITPNVLETIVRNTQDIYHAIRR